MSRYAGKEKKKSIRDIIAEVKKAYDDREIESSFLTMKSIDKKIILLSHCEQENTVDVGSIDEVITEIHDWLFSKKDIRYHLLVDQIKKVAQSLVLHFERLDDKPIVLGTRDEMDKLAFARVPFEFDQGKCPLHDELLSRTTNANALELFIGSLFRNDSNNGQYVWLYGDGGNGKSSLAKELEYTLGRSYGAEFAPSKDNKFWTHGLMQRRLVVFAEMEQAQSDFPSSGLFKSITGGESIKVEGKGTPSYTTRLDAKYMFISNSPPAVKDSDSDRRRAIYCEIEPINGKPDPLYDMKLQAESPKFMYRCLIKYLSHAAQNGPGPLPVDEDSLDKISATYVDLMQSVFDEFFIYTFDVTKTAAENDFVTASELTSALLSHKMVRKNYQIDAFKAYLRKKYSIEYKQLRIKNGARTRGYLGMKLKNQTPARGATKASEYSEILKIVPKTTHAGPSD